MRYRCRFVLFLFFTTDHFTQQSATSETHSQCSVWWRCANAATLALWPPVSCVEFVDGAALGLEASNLQRFDQTAVEGHTGPHVHLDTHIKHTTSSTPNYNTTHTILSGEDTLVLIYTEIIYYIDQSELRPTLPRSWGQRNKKRTIRGLNFG